MTLGHRGQEVVPVTVSSPVSPPTQGEQTTEQDCQRSDNAPNDRTNGTPIESR